MPQIERTVLSLHSQIGEWSLYQVSFSHYVGPPDVRSAALLSKPPERRFVFRWTFSLTLLNTEISFFNYFEKLNVGISDDAAYDGLKMGEKFFVDLSHVKNDSDRTFGVYEVTAVV